MAGRLAFSFMTPMERGEARADDSTIPCGTIADIWFLFLNATASIRSTHSKCSSLVERIQELMDELTGQSAATFVSSS
jgi:hypothetical protein